MRIAFEHEFGRAVAHYVERTGCGVPGVPVSEILRHGRLSDPIVVAAGAYRPATMHAIERLARSARVAWAPVFLTHRYLYCGPVIVPDAPPCLLCFRRRMLSLVRPEFAEHEVALESLADSESGFEIPGFLPSTVAFATHVAELLSAAMESYAGHVLRAAFVSPQMEWHRILPIHGCPVCGDEPSRERFVARLIEALPARR